MKLNAPKKSTWWVSVIIAALAIISVWIVDSYKVALNFRILERVLLSISHFHGFCFYATLHRLTYGLAR